MLNAYKVKQIKQLQGIKEEEKALVVTDIEVLKRTLSKQAVEFADFSDNGLYCLNFVPDAILSNKDLLLEIFSEYYMELNFSYSFHNYDMIPKEILTDPQFLITIIKVSPYNLYYIIEDFKKMID